MSDTEELISEARNWNDRIGNPLARGVLTSADLNAAVTAVERALTALEAAQANLAASQSVISEARVHNAQFLVDHSGHIDADGNQCGEAETWINRSSRDLAAILAQSPADALAAAKADAWDEGVRAGKDPVRYGDAEFYTWDSVESTFYVKPGVDPLRRNPYRTTPTEGATPTEKAVK